MTKSMKPLAAVIGGLTLMTAIPVIAQTTDESGARIYQADYFQQYAPQTAFEMVRRVPGFQLRGGNNARGLGQGGANVLVNGQQLTGKGGDTFGQVDRIPAENVVRIELLDGTSLDIPGLSGQVVNVITKSQSGTSGSWEWNPEWRQRQVPNLLRGNIKLSGERGDISWAAELRNRARRNGDYGPETRRNPDGSIYEVRRYYGRYDADAPGISTNLTWKPTEDRVGNLNFEYNIYDFERRSGYFVDPVTDRSEGGEEIFNFTEDEWNAKVDGDYQFPFLNGKLKLIGYYRGEHSPTFSRFFDYNQGVGLETQTEFEQVADEGEAIAKTEYSWSPQEGRDWQISLEGAYNFLDIENQFRDILYPENSGDLSFLEIEESRAEAFLTHSRKINDKWSMQASLGGEYSELTAGGSTRTFKRPKGTLSVTYTPDETLNVTTKFERQVGQLNFFDFSSSVSLQEEVGDRGTNLELVPSQSWYGEISLNKTFKGGHTLEVLAHGNLFEDIVDSIPITDTNGDPTTGIGNIGSGETGGVHINTLLKGEPFGLKGMELRTNLSWHLSQVTDPITLEKRQFSGYSNSDFNISFRHDIPKTDWAWGFYFGSFENTSNYSPFVIQRFDNRPGWNEIYVEHKDVWGMRVVAELGAVIPVYDQLDRLIYSGRRDLFGLDRIENRRREYDGPYLEISISDTF